MRLAFVFGPEPDTVPAGILQVRRRQAGRLAAALAERGHDVTVYLEPRADPPAGAVGVQLAHAPRGSTTPGAFADFLAHRWGGALPDVVHAAGVGSCLAVLSAAPDRSVPLVQDTRGVTDGRLVRALQRRAAQVFALSSAEAEQMRRRGLHADKLAVLPYGLAAGAEAPGPSRAAAEPETGRRPTIVCPDGFDLAGGAHDVVAALAKLPEVDLEVLAPETYGKDARALRALILRLGLRERVRLVKEVSGEETARRCAEADLVVSVPRIPTDGQTCLTAMAAGACVVATPLGPAADAILHGITGVFVPPAAPAKVGTAVRALLAEPARAAAYGVAGADRAQARYAWAQLAQDGERAYARAAAG